MLGALLTINSMETAMEQSGVSPTQSSGAGQADFVWDHLVPDASDDAVADPRESEQDALISAARDFEAFFIQYMLKVMRAATMRSSLFDGGFARDTYEAMLDESLADEMAQAGGVGLAQVLLDDMSSQGWIG